MFTDDNANLRVRAFLDGKSYGIDSATVDVWNPSDSQVVTAGTAAISGNEASYLVATSVLSAAGTYTYEFHVTFANNQGVLTFQGTFEVTARKT